MREEPNPLHYDVCRHYAINVNVTETQKEEHRSLHPTHLSLAMVPSSSPSGRCSASRWRIPRYCMFDSLPPPPADSENERFSTNLRI